MKLYNGIVENIHDETLQGLVQVRVFGCHTDNLNHLPTEKLAWSTVIGPTTSPGISGIGHSSYLIQGGKVVGFWADELAQDFVILGTLPTMSSDTIPNTQKGFCDPTGIMPRALETEDNNIRARGGEDPDFEFEGGPIGRGIYQPFSDYNPVYPYNHVYETESGHLKEYDDTKGSERIREKHMSGTYYEIQTNGTKVERIQKDNYQLIIGDDTIEVKGCVNIICSQNVNIVTGGNIDAFAQGEIIVKGEMSCNINIDNKINIEAGDDIKIHTKTNAHIFADKDILIAAKQDVNITADKDINILAEGIINMKAKDDINITSDKNVNIRSGSIDGKIHLNE